MLSFIQMNYFGITSMLLTKKTDKKIIGSLGFILPILVCHFSSHFFSFELH